MNQTVRQFSHPEGLTQKGQKRREEIISVARQRLINNGYDAFVLREIAEEMGSSLGNIQYYFPTRRDLLAAVVANEITSDIDDALGAGTDEHDAEEKLKKFCAAILTRWEGEAGTVWTAMSFFRLHYDEVMELWEVIYGLFYDALIEIIGEIRPDDSIAVLKRKAMLVTSLLDGANMQPKMQSKSQQNGQAKSNTDFMANVPLIALALVKDN